ncbi:MAG: FAD:protein FMN transferase [Armatimonadia bacterium]|nr:FAD:protein FMN transferase [Armatimonadia bacterium]
MRSAQAVDNQHGGLEVGAGDYRLRRREEAMGSVFQIILDGDRPEVELRALIESAFTDVVHPLEMQLSHYRPSSDIGWINSRAHREPVPVEPRLFELLVECSELTSLTRGAFDITVGPLIRCWGFYRKDGRVPPSEEISRALDVVGMHHVILDPEARTVAFDREGVELNLGGIGKGYVVDRVVEYLRHHGADCALAESGGSTIYALGQPPIDPEGWRLGIRPAGQDTERLGAVHLVDQALSTSGDFRRFFVEDGVRYGHIVDPRSGWPAQGVRAACSITSSATRADALSTAFVVLGPEDTEALCSNNGECALMMTLDEEDSPEINQIGCEPLERTRPPDAGG